MTRIAWATGDGFAEHDTDLPPLDRAATDAGLTANTVRWDDPAVDWSAYDLVVVRSCWDYVPRREEFLSWARAVPRLANPADLLAWNTDKTYLRALAEAGVAIVETVWSLDSVDELPDAEEWVVKPAISAGAADTARWSDPDRAVEHSRRLVAAGRTSMTQPYVASVDEAGETGLLFFGGAYSHAFRKGALLAREHDPRAEPELQEDIAAREPSPGDVAFARSVLEAAHGITGVDPLYARVDVVTGADGEPRLMELELTEPSFFLPTTPTGAQTFVAALLDRL